jgi:hypothetical protein
MPDDIIKKRIQSLFSDIEHLAAHPQLDAAVMRRELETLRARVAALEEQVVKPLNIPANLETEETAPQQPVHPTVSIPLLYEKEQVGFAYTEERLEPLKSVRLNNLDVQQSIHAPLTETGKLIGSVLVEPPTRNHIFIRRNQIN